MESQAKPRERSRVKRGGLLRGRARWIEQFANADVVSDVAPAICLGIGVDDLTPDSRLGHNEPVIVAYLRCGVHYERNHLALARFAQKRNDAVIRVVKIDPIKTFIGVVELPKRRFAFVDVVQMLRQPAYSVVPGQLCQMPVETYVVVPLVELAEFTTHE